MEAGREWTQQGQNTDGLELREHMKTEQECVRADSPETAAAALTFMESHCNVFLTFTAPEQQT